MVVLGITAYYHDSSAALIVNGQIVAGALEERFSRKKHDNRFPILAIQFCMEYAGISLDDVDIITFYEKPFRKFERIIKDSIVYAPKSYDRFEVCSYMAQRTTEYAKDHKERIERSL